MRYWILPLAMAMIYTGVSEADVQRSGDDTGQCSIEADLVDVDDGWVVLEMADGKVVELPADELSRADRRWVRHRAATAPRCGPAIAGRISGGTGG